jgi:Ni,Fe-hydrogenase I large subunit
VRAEAQRIEWACAPFDPLNAGEQDKREFAVAVDTLTGFAERPLWHGAPAETGTWTRAAGADPARNAWQRLGSRLADLARIAAGRLPAAGALRLADGEGIAWTEMSRGLLVHWVRLADDERDPTTARAQRYRVIAPTEWNFHPDGAFARLAGSGRLDAARLRLAAATLDPCVGFTIETENPPA